MTISEKKIAQYKKDLTEIIGEGWTPNADVQVIREMLFNVAQLKEEKLDLTELRLLNTALKELRYALRVFKPYRAVPKAAVFGSARTSRHHPDYKHAAHFGRKLAKKGWMLITGGASGIMEAAMLGAGVENSFGLNIMLPFEQDANPIIKGNQKLVFFKYFFTRKLMFLKESQATVLFPGGFGTFDEGFESFTLVQTGKAKPRPLVLVDTPESSFWRSTLKLLKRNMEGSGLITKGDLDLMRHFQDPDQAVAELEHFYSNYHSSRFFSHRYLVRVKKPFGPTLLTRLDREFKDMLAGGNFEHMTDTAEDDNKDPSIHRIVFAFNRTSYHRMRHLIDVLNEL